MRIPPQLICERHSQPLTTANPDGRVEDAAALTCSQDCCVPIVEGIPRFVDRDNYASGFGLQWKAFSKTQLDSHTGTTISRDRLARCLGGSMGVVRDKNVLEVGCGAGRFTEVLLQSGAKVFACDLSPAVEANYDNCHASQNYFVCQADARHVPIAPHSFDFVICLGVIQHTPSPEETIAALSRYVRPGGTLIIDHYTHSYPRNFFQRNLRRVLIRLPPRRAKSAALMLAQLLLPFHRLSWNKRRGVWRLRRFLARHSPLIDYYETYPQLDKQTLSEWSVLDTHDTLTDFYKHLRTAEEVESALRRCGLTDLEVSYAGNGVEARAKMPLPLDYASSET